ncbi:hypothetical protein DFH29DRAFT_597205 [Suillus ampliporus]|nr:hypothetical protein DFH29DRAFT_597205 [Suillus ampliporus]
MTMMPGLDNCRMSIHNYVDFFAHTLVQGMIVPLLSPSALLAPRTPSLKPHSWTGGRVLACIGLVFDVFGIAVGRPAA